MNLLYNKKIVIMGGGTSGWTAALYFLIKNAQLNLNLNVVLISSEEIGTIGVGEGTTIPFKNFIEDFCKIQPNIFLKETKGSYKFGIKFDNWNFDNQYYYHLFGHHSSYDNPNYEMIYDFCQYAINNTNISQDLLQKKIHGLTYDLVENNKINFQLNSNYAYHFDAALVIEFYKKMCSSFVNFYHIDDTITKVDYWENQNIKKLTLKNTQVVGDIFINCLGFSSSNIISSDYFDIEDLSKIIPNNSAVTLQVKNRQSDTIENYTTSTAQDYGWSWKIPQYEKTGYGYVYSDSYIKDEENLIESIIKTYKIDKKLILKTNSVKFKTYYNRKCFYNNCLSLGLSSGFIEPLEATSIATTLNTLNAWFSMIENVNELSDGVYKKFNRGIEELWKSIYNFVLLHYYNGSTKNSYWKHFTDLKHSKDFSIEKSDYHKISFSFPKTSYFNVSLGLRIRDDYYSFENEPFLKYNMDSFFSVQQKVDLKKIHTHNEILKTINN